MPNKKMSKREKDIKGKLMAAIAMLLVSSIMMVSTTYAWFTLSTAPEVKGIQTAVGANGNLEMALLPSNGSLPAESAVGDAMLGQKEKNVTWGNLVDVSENTVYGLNQVVLNPSALSYVQGSTTQINTNNFVEFPQYGADGRVSELSKNAVYAIYADNQFLPAENVFGVRAVGASSGMTPRQLAYRNARSNASTAMGQAKNEAQASLAAHGDQLANLAIKKATNQDTYTEKDVQAVQGIVTSLKANVLPKIEYAYMQYILAYAASSYASGANAELAWQAVSSLVNANGAHLLKADDSDTTGLLSGSDGSYILNVTLTDGTSATVGMPDGIGEFIKKYENTLKKVDEAQNLINTTLVGKAESELSWNNFGPVLERLANPTTMTVNGNTPAQVKENMNSLVQDVAGGKGITVAMANGGGVYADVAEHCGDYTTAVEIEEINYNGWTFGPLTARMETQCVGSGDSKVAAAYLNVIGGTLTADKAPSSDGAAAMPLSETYAFIVDLAFRTNASGSNLQLQAKPTDRIYSDNASDAETMGGGATMTFKATSTDFSDQNVKDLMENIKIVFFAPDGDNKGTVYAYAKLDVANAKVTADGVTAEMYIYEKLAAAEDVYIKTTFDKDSTKTYYTKGTETVDVYTEYTGNTAPEAGTQLYTKADDGSYSTATFDPDATDVPYYTKGTKTQDKYTRITKEQAEVAGVQLYTVQNTTDKPVANNTIMALPQNEAVKVSVLVYLDGNTITNSDVSIGASSMTGTMNLQFSSSATLVPMEYGNLHTPANGGNAEGGEQGGGETPDAQG